MSEQLLSELNPQNLDKSTTTGEINNKITINLLSINELNKEKIIPKKISKKDIIKIKSTESLIKELEQLKSNFTQERIESLSKINELNAINDENNIKLKQLSKDYIKRIQNLKNHEKILNIRMKLLKFNNKSKNKSEADLKKDIKLKAIQIQLYEKKAYNIKEEYEKSCKKMKKELNKETTLKNILLKLNSDITKTNCDILKLKIFKNAHKNCEKEKNKLIESYDTLKNDYEYELKRSKILSKIKIKGEEDELIQEEYDKMDEDKKAEVDAKNLLPKIKILKFKNEQMKKLEMKIIKLNKLGLKKNDDKIENSTQLYKKIDNIYKDKNSYIKRANSNIRKYRQKNNIISEDRYLFSEDDAKIMEKIIPEKMINSYKNKYNDILEIKKEIQNKFNKENNSKKNENDILINFNDANILKNRSIKNDELKLILKSQKLRNKINYIKKNIFEVKEKIKIEEKKLQEKQKDEKRIYLYFKKYI